MSRKFKLRQFLGNQVFLDYKPDKFWNERLDGRGADETNGFAQWFDDYIKFLKENNCKSVLEIGCGSGVNLGYIKSKLPDVKCVGFDLSKYHISLGKKRYPNVEFYLTDLVKKLPSVESNSFDCVLCAGILMHVLPKHIDLVVKEIKRISSSAIFLYEQDKRFKFGLRHPNNFVFFHDYRSLFGDLNKVFWKEYNNKHFALGLDNEAKKK